ncbi:hypothetical protein [Halocynthiibacter styelae]|uniref:Uncharacterized protein n=1 Tax=Halocynthiibacter styelae TaxID=2761955 RepID=A0A8J7IK30_9RHOB|nr:hypothetical protein [Paenihalocynthiibacter styelae]MBI1494678.1 hypothetical protein [Paenihalocynthiibacter styelae]
MKHQKGRSEMKCEIYKKAGIKALVIALATTLMAGQASACIYNAQKSLSFPDQSAKSVQQQLSFSFSNRGPGKLQSSDSKRLFASVGKDVVRSKNLPAQKEDAARTVVKLRK